MPVKSDDHEEDIRLLLEHLPNGMSRAGVIHVGAHLGEEVEAYFKAGFERVLLIEANPLCCSMLEERFQGDDRVRVFNCAISDRGGEVMLHLHTSRTGSTEPASLLQMKDLKRIVKTLSTPRSIQVECHSLDEFVSARRMDVRELSLLNLDIQGSELRALQGATQTLESLGAVIAEVSLIELYEGGASEEELVEWLTLHDFRKDYAIYHSLHDETGTFPAWGECLFLRAHAL